MKHQHVSIVFIVYFSIKSDALIQKPLSEDGQLGYCGIALKYGHQCEAYNVTTIDSYILTMFRIPKINGSIVLLIHGNLDTADTWIMRGNDSMAMALANLGYDVWVLNCRGNRFSRNHLYLNPDTNPEFWNYSFYEVAIYDIPASIDTILAITGKPQLSIIGHSQGTTATFVLGCEKPEYHSKIKNLIALAPVVFLDHMPVHLKLATLLGNAGLSNLLNNMLGEQEVLGYNASAFILKPVCLNSITGYVVCIEALLFPLIGYDTSGFESEFVTTFFGHYPGGTSHKTMTHFSQVAQRGKFAKYDYGEKNKEIYNSTSPPEFNLQNVQFDVTLVLGKNDPVGTIDDAENLRGKLSGFVELIVLDYDRFNHFDFTIGKHMPKTLFPDVFNVLQRYNL